MWLKRVPNYNHDFLATWLNVANIIIAFFLGGLKAYDSIEWVEDKEYVRRVKVWLILGVMIISQSLVYMVHNLINCFKTRNTKRGSVFDHIMDTFGSSGELDVNRPVFWAYMPFLDALSDFRP